MFEGDHPAAKGKKLPLCLKGKGACPPEDIGNVWGYYEFLETIADPKHERHEELMEWGGPFDPESFDAARATKAMQEGLPKWMG